MIEIAYNKLESAAEFSKRVFFPRCYFRAACEDFGDAASKLHGAIVSHISKQTQKMQRRHSIHNLEKEIHLFTEKMHKLEEKHADQLYFFPGGEDDEVVPEGDKAKMVGFSDNFNHLKQMLTNSIKFRVVSLCGMPGTGKTILAREIFEDPDIEERFTCRVWVKVGRKCGFKEILRRILAEVSPKKMCVEEDEDVVWWLNELLKGKTFLIVLDDVWDKYAAHCLATFAYSSRRNKWKCCFPYEENGSRVLVISRAQQIYNIMYEFDDTMEMQLMSKEESWHLLREKVFGQEWCPSQLEAFGRKIAEKCEGLPLTIVTVASLLSKQDKTVEYWKEVATRKKHQLFKVAYDEILKVLLPSFNHLPRSLQMCFMYMGVFPQYYNISRSRIISLWYVDRFLEHNGGLLTTYEGIEYLQELVLNNMVMIHKKTTNPITSLVGDLHIKTCRLHISLWYLSNTEARRNKFSYVLDSFDDGFGEDIKSQHRLSFHNNVLFAIKDVHASVEDSCASTAHSLFCYGPYLQYQVPICFGLRLLNKLDALAIRLYEFPMEVLQLVELRYLALLIVHPHQSIKSFKESSYLLMEIWNMKELQHLQVMGKDLPNPCGASLERLMTLSKVSPNSCSVDILRGIPSLTKLGIEVELSHDNDGEPFSCLAHVSHLLRLEELKCVVVNPMFFPSLSPLSYFLTNLVKLTLNGLGYAGEEMSKIGSLEGLAMLKLQNYAFRGPEWKVGEEQFPALDSLIIEDTDLERWRLGYHVLGSLIIKRCYKLKEIDGDFGEYFEKIEIVDCNPSGTEQMKRAASSAEEVKVSCSWHDKKGRA